MKICALILLVGLSASGMTLHNKASQKTTGEFFQGAGTNSQAISSVTQGQRTAPMTVTSSGQSNVITTYVVPSDTVKEMVNANQSVSVATQETATMNTKSEVHLPLSIAILIGSIGLLVLLLAIWIARKQFLAVDAAVKCSDTAIANVIGIVDAKLATSSDDKQNANLAVIHSALNKARGQINSK